MGNKPKNNNGINRRKCLKSITAGSISATFVGQASGKGPTKTIVVADSLDGSKKTREASKSWYNHTLAVERKAENLKDRILKDPTVSSIGVDRAESATGGFRNKSIRVGLKKRSTNATIPEDIGGTPVNVHENESEKYNCYSGSYDDLKGGITVESGTLTGRAYNSRESEWQMVTARHLFKKCDTSSLEGTDVYRGWEKIGTIDTDMVEYDAVSFTPTTSYSDEIVDEDANIDYYITEDGVRTYQSDGTTFKARGKIACSTSGLTINSYDNDLVLCDDNGQIQHDMIYIDQHFSDDGDSGGPIYLDEGNEAQMLMLISGGIDTDGSSYSFGSSAYSLHETWDVTLT